jgi:hypothetical protein
MCFSLERKLDQGDYEFVFAIHNLYMNAKRSVITDQHVPSRNQVIALVERKTNPSLILILLLITSISLTAASVSGSHASPVSALIEVEGFRWTMFPLKVRT